MALYKAAGKGNGTEVARLLAAGADPDARGEEGLTALHAAAVCGHTRVVRTMLAGGASPMQPGMAGMLPIHMAAACGKLAATRLLLEAAPGTAVAVDQAGHTPLFLAAQRGDAPLVRLLTAAAPQAAVVKTVDGQETPLFAAARGGHDNVVHMLVEAAPEAAVEVSVQHGGSGLTPLLAACVQGHTAVVRQLLEAAPQAALVRSSDGMLPLHATAAIADGPCGAAIAQLLLAAVPAAATAVLWQDVNTPLHIAVARGNAAVAAVLAPAAPAAVLMPPGESRATPLEMTLLKASQVAQQHGAAEAGNAGQLLPAAAYLDTARPMLAAMPPHVSLPILVRWAPAVSLPLFPVVAAHWPLSAAQWEQVPAPCPGLGRTLPAIFQRSQAEAALLVARLPPADSARLRAFALALHRAQHCMHIHLPAELVGRILSLFDAFDV